MVQLVLQVVLCDEHWEDGRSINKANNYRAEVNLKLLFLAYSNFRVYEFL